MSLERTYVWRKLRERKILRQHARVAAICEDLIARYRAGGPVVELKAKKDLGTEKIIWQYWAQGYDEVPPVVQECLDSVEEFAGDYTLVRLTDDNLSEDLDLPEFVQSKRSLYSRAFFSDLLRVMLLSVYGGVWLDATILMTGNIPEEYSVCDFFVFYRDPKEPYYRYWRNTYAYYYGWAKGFRVNMLSSIMVAKKGSRTVSDLCALMLKWWKENDYLPDYFFLQILFDVYGPPADMSRVSDTLPHYMQQSINDPAFSLMSREQIKASIPLHKLTYK